jgi:hypothetical protein
MTETYLSDNRDKGDPHEWEVQFKWSAMTTDTILWAQFAPECLAMLKEAFDGYLDEHGEELHIFTSCRENGNVGLLTFKAEGDSLRMQVTMSLVVEDDEEFEATGSYLVDNLATALDLADKLESELLELEASWSGSV